MFHFRFVIPLALALAVATFATVTASPVSTDLFSMQPGERLLDAIPRPRGGTYLIVGRSAEVQGAVIANLFAIIPGDFTNALVPQDRYRWISATSFLRIGLLPTAIVRLGSSNEEVARISFGATTTATFQKALVDSDGSLIVLLNSSYPGLPLVDPLFPLEVPTLPPPPVGFPKSFSYVLKTNSAGTAIERSTLIGGTEAPEFTLGTYARDIAQDSAGNLYITGSTSHRDFPVSSNAAKSDARFDLEIKAEEGFLLKLSGDLKRLIYSTYLGSDEALPESCISADAFAPLSHTSTGYAVQVGAQQQAVVYAVTNGHPLPATPGAYQAIDPPGTPACQNPPRMLHDPLSPQRSVSLLRFDTTGSRVIASAYLGKSAVPSFNGARGATLQQLPDFNFVASLSQARVDDGAAFRLMKLDAGLAQVLAGRDLTAGMMPLLGRSLTQQADGTLWLEGQMWPSTPLLDDGIAGLPPSIHLGSDFVLRIRGFDLNPTGLWMFPNGVGQAGVRVSPSSVDLLSFAGTRTRIPFFDQLSPSVLGVANAAGLTVKATVSPYEFLSLYGTGLGPDTGSGTAFSSSGNLPTLHEGVRVWIDGVAAPLLYVSARQINLIAPAQLAGRSPGTRVLVEVEYDGTIVATVPMLTTGASPHLFRHSEGSSLSEAIVLNADGSVNAPNHPARQGEPIVLFLNGAGAPVDMFPAGKRVDAARPFSVLTPTVRSQGPFANQPREDPPASWTIDYFGSAPGLAAGTLQLNVRVPQNLEIQFNLPAPYPVIATLRLAGGQQQGNPEQEPLEQSFTVWTVSAP